MATEHRFSARLRWDKSAPGSEAGNHRVEFSGRPAIEVSAAPQYKGDASRLNPEELFVASLASCQMLTYLALARGSRLDVVSYEDEATATLAMADKRMRITGVLLRPRIMVAPGGDVAKATALVESAHRGCFIANSVACTVRCEPQIEIAQ
jgi:organic hydroperoxide reductase OsmC/OhrA